MNKKILLIPLISLSLIGCDQKPTTPKAVNTHPSSYNADNTGKNVRDRDGVLPTADNQSETEADRTLVQNIRKEVEKTSLSTNAKNIKIISSNGVVVLRGPVNTENEKVELGNIAKKIAGVVNVNNHLEVIQK